MSANEDFENEVKHLLDRNYPELDVARVDVRDIIDSAGEPSLDVIVILRRRPAKRDIERNWQVMDQFRTWLAGRNDDRFPYFRFLTEQEERDLARPDA